MTPSPPTKKTPLTRYSERLRGKPSPSYAPQPKKKRKISTAISDAGMTLTNDRKNIGIKEAMVEASNAAVTPPDSDKYEGKDDNALSKEEEHEANEQQQKLEEDVAIIGGNPTVFQRCFTHTRFKQFRSEVTKCMLARDWPRMLKIVEKLPYACQKEENCKNSYEALQGITRENIRGEGELEALAKAYAAAAEIVDYVVETCSNVIEVNCKLTFLSRRSQSDSTSTTTAKLSIALGNRSARNTASNDAAWAQDCMEVQLQREPGQLWNEPSEKLETLGDKRIGDLSVLEDRYKKRLRKFSASLQSLMKGAKVFNDKPVESVKTAFNCDLDQFEKALCECSEKEESSLLVPGPMAAEVDYTQPFLLVVLQALGSAIDETAIDETASDETAIDETASDETAIDETAIGETAIDKTAIDCSPAKTSVQTNRICPKTDFRPKRIADKSISANGRFIFLLRDDSVEIPVEEKRGQRSGSKPSDSLVQCSNQILSYLAKHVGIGFNFAGVGVDTKATGVVLTPAYVNIIQLQLKHAGTREIALTKYETRCLPLLLQENFVRWTDAFAEDWSDLKTRLYPPGVPEPEVPVGLVALCNLMTSSRNDLFGPSPWESGCIQDLIGFGEYASVYSGKAKYKDCVIKLSRYGAKSALEREATALQALKDFPSDFITRLITPGLETLTVEIGGVLKDLPALILQPHAISVPHYIASLDIKDKEDALRAIGTDVANGVSFIHDKGIFHNDVSPKNILVNITGTQPKNATGILIDFGIASLLSEQIIGFQGTPCFVHRAVFCKYPSKPWKPKPDYDKSSLAFSMAALTWTVPSNEKNALWKSFQPSDSGDTTQALDEWATNRSNSAWTYLKEAGFPDEDEKDPEIQWKKWCFDSL